MDCFDIFKRMGGVEEKPVVKQGAERCSIIYFTQIQAETVLSQVWGLTVFTFVTNYKHNYLREVLKESKKITNKNPNDISFGDAVEIFARNVTIFALMYDGKCSV